MTEPQPPTNQAQDAFAQQLAVSLREAEEQLPAEVASRLNQARHNALASTEAKTQGRTAIRPSLWPRLAGASAFALVAAVGVVMLQDDVQTLPRMPDEEMFAAQDVEFLEALEFVAWMAEQETPDA